MLQHIGYIDLPIHLGAGGFDHAAAHARTGRIFVAHTANDAVDVIDPEARVRVFSIPNLRGVAGVFISDESQLVFTSNRAENTIGIWRVAFNAASTAGVPPVTKIKSTRSAMSSATSRGNCS